MKIYSLALFYREKEDYDKWLEEKTLSSIEIKISGRYPYQEVKVKTKNGYGPYGEVVFERWHTYKYSYDRPVNEFMCGHELYYFELLDGFYKAEDIMYLMSRIRMGVGEVEDE